jgi:hypothetical protein
MILPGCCRNFSIADVKGAFAFRQMPVNAVGKEYAQWALDCCRDAGVPLKEKRSARLN